MNDAELLTLAEREAERLAEENDHCASALMRALCDRVREHLIRAHDASSAPPALAAPLRIH